MDTFADARERDILNLAEVASSTSRTFPYTESFCLRGLAWSLEPSAAGAGAGRGCRQVTSLNPSPVKPGLGDNYTNYTKGRQLHSVFLTS